MARAAPQQYRTAYLNFGSHTLAGLYNRPRFLQINPIPSQLLRTYSDYTRDGAEP
jgi:hypothetical protein